MVPELCLHSSTTNRLGPVRPTFFPAIINHTGQLVFFPQVFYSQKSDSFKVKIDLTLLDKLSRGTQILEQHVVKKPSPPLASHGAPLWQDEKIDACLPFNKRACNSLKKHVLLSCAGPGGPS